MSPVPDNPLFRRLAIIAACLALSSVATWIVSTATGNTMWSLKIESLCFLTGLALALVFILADGGAGLRLHTALWIVVSFSLTFLYWMAACWMEFSYLPEDGLLMFIIPGFVFSSIAIVAGGKASLRAVFSVRFLRVIVRSLIPLSIYWSVIALAGSRVVAWLSHPGVFRGDLWELGLP